MTHSLSTRQPGEKQQCDSNTIPSLGVVIGPLCPLKVLRHAITPLNIQYSAEPIWSASGRVRGSQSGTLLWKVSVSTVHADRKRWLMSRRLFPAVRQTPEKAEVTSVTLSLLGEQRRKLLFGFPNPGDQLRVRVTGTRVENYTGGHLPPCLLSRNGKR